MHSMPSGANVLKTTAPVKIPGLVPSMPAEAKCLKNYNCQGMPHGQNVLKTTITSESPRGPSEGLAPSMPSGAKLFRKLHIPPVKLSESAAW